MDGKVGIIFMRGNGLWIDSTTVRDAVDYGALKTHDQGHPSYWEQLQERHAVPQEEESTKSHAAGSRMTLEGKSTFCSLTVAYASVRMWCPRYSRQCICRPFQRQRSVVIPTTFVRA